MLPLEMQTLSRLMAAGPSWLGDIRQRGFQLYEKLDMPSSQEEVWRYVDLDFDLEGLALPADPGPPLQEASPVAEALPEVAGRATVVDGFTTDISHEAGDEVLFTSLRQAVSDHEGQLRGSLATGIPADLDIFSAAHHAFLGDGVFLYVPSGRTVEAPFFVDVQATTEGALILPHVTVVVEVNAEASLVIGYRSSQEQFLVTVPQVEASVRDDARFRLSTVQDWGYDTRAIAQERVVGARDTSLRIGEAGLGCRIGRLHLTVDLLGKGCSAEVVGLYFGELEQLLDYRLFMNHVGTHTTSDVFLKGAVEDRSHSVFTGLIKIWKDAQKTDAFETNRNLVLSAGAGAESVPNLEILANDVRCGHGSTVGPIDEEQRYYLMSRGLPRARADQLIVKGFFEEVLDRFPQAELAEPLREGVNDKFVTAQQEGRI
ncbi:MAG: Fe-S cluster assembly protein SufD [Actinomycetota bacterium]|nr:Fe-S cluster assembly protein SufD [Actinomycetota bacterium]